MAKRQPFIYLRFTIWQILWLLLIVGVTANCLCPSLRN